MPATDVAIVGAGFCGTLLGRHLSRAGIDCLLVGDRETFGRGRAYATDRSEHLLNVPAGGMSAFPDDPDHFRRWLASTGVAATSADFLPRPVYGQYLQAVLADSNADRIEGDIVSVVPSAEGWTLASASGARISARHVVLATGHRRPRPPAFLNGLGARLLADPYAPGALAALPPTASVLVVGTGLTAADSLATLHALRHRGPVVALSRHGRWPALHDSNSTDHPLCRSPAASASGYASWFRDEIEDARAAGRDWRRVIDAVRARAQPLWCALPLDAQARLLRHARNLWDVARHQMPPPTSARIDDLRTTGQLRSVAGRIVDVAVAGASCRVTIRDARGECRRIDFDYAISCVGTETAPHRGGDHLLDRLLAANRISVDGLGIGVQTDAAGRCVTADGRPSQSLFAMGPLRRGTLGENIAVPELRAEALSLARHLATDTENRRDVPAIARSET